MDESRGPPPSSGGAPPERSMTRLYVGNLPNDVERRDVEQLFSKYGTILDVSVKRTVSGAPFAFIEFDNDRDVQDAISGRDGYNFNGHRLRVEVPFASRGGPPRGRGGAGGFRGGGGRGGAMGTPRRGEFRVLISGLPPSGSWQDLKDHMRDAGDCVFADVFRDGNGVVEFGRREDVEYAMRYFNDSKFRSHEGESSRITLRIPDDRRRSPSPYMGGGGGRYEGRGGGRGGYPDDSGPPPRYEDAPSRHDDGYRGGRGGGGGGGQYYEERPVRRRSMSPGYGGGGGGGGYRPRGPSRSRSRSRSR